MTDVNKNGAEMDPYVDRPLYPQPNSPDFYRGMYQAILAEEPHTADVGAREDAVWYRLEDMANEGLINETEMMECYDQFITTTRPDVVILRLGTITLNNPENYFNE